MPVSSTFIELLLVDMLTFSTSKAKHVLQHQNLFVFVSVWRCLLSVASPSESLCAAVHKVASRSEWCKNRGPVLRWWLRAVAGGHNTVLHSGSHRVASRCLSCWVVVASWLTSWQMRAERTTCCGYSWNALRPPSTPPVTRRTCRRRWENMQNACADCTKRCATIRCVNVAPNASWKRR